MTRLPLLVAMRTVSAGGAFPDVTGAAFAVLLVLADFATTERPEWAPEGGDAWAWPSRAELARRSRVSVATVKRAVRQLEDAGVVQVERRPGGSSGYVLRIGTGVEVTRPDDMGGRVTMHQGGRVTMHQGGRVTMHQGGRVNLTRPDVDEPAAFQSDENLQGSTLPGRVNLTRLTPEPGEVDGGGRVNLTRGVGSNRPGGRVNLTPDSPMLSQDLSQKIPAAGVDLDPGETRAPAPTRTREATPRARWETPAPLVVPSADPRTQVPSPADGAFAPACNIGFNQVSGAGGTVDPSENGNAFLASPDGQAETPAPAGLMGAILGGIGQGGQGPLRRRPQFAPEPIPARPARPDPTPGQGDPTPPPHGGLTVTPPPEARGGMGESRVGEGAGSPIPSPPPSSRRSPSEPPKQNESPVASIRRVLGAHPYAPALGLDLDELAEVLFFAAKGRELAHVLGALGKGLDLVQAERNVGNRARGRLRQFVLNASAADLPPEERPSVERHEELPEGWHFPAAVRTALERYQAKQTLGLCLDPVEAERVFVENDEGHGYSVRSVRMRRSEWVPAVLRYLRRQADRVGAYLPAELKSDALAGLDPSTCLAGLPPRGRRTEPRPEGAVTRAEADETRGATQRLAVHLAKAGLPFPGQPTGTSTT